MPRGARRLTSGGTYHVMSRGNNGQTIFRHEEDHQRYLRLLAAYLRQYQARLYHFALLPTHAHLLLAVEHGPALSHLMRGLNLSYTLYVRQRHQYAGHLWRGRFKSLLLQPEDLLACGRYIELHPVRSGLSQDPDGYLWSSYSVYAEAAFSPLVTPSPAFAALGSTPSEQRVRYRRFVLNTLETMRQHAGHALPATGTCCPMPDEKIGFLIRRAPSRAAAITLTR
jgi:putative transposase